MLTEADATAMATWCRGQWSPGPPSSLAGASQDTRTLKGGELYVAIRGPTHDGHDFVDDAFAKGAAAALVHRRAGVQPAPGRPLLEVDDSVAALGAIATGYRRGLSGTIVGVTGSVGKTTVKEMTADLLAAGRRICRSPGNWNNDIGLPLSLLRMDRADEAGIFELGMNRSGEISTLAAILRPDIGVVTNIAAAHAGAFDQLEDIAREKSALLAALDPSGVSVLCRDDRFFSLLAATAPGQVTTISLNDDADYTLVERRAGICVVREAATGENLAFAPPLPGLHHVANAMFAIAVARSQGLAWADLRPTLEAFQPQPMRWQVERLAGRTIVNDAYNANPLSMRGALEAFAEEPVEGARWLVLGGMLELGAAEAAEHGALGERIAGGDWDGVITVGELAGRIAAAAAGAGMPAERLHRCAEVDQAAAVLDEATRAHDAVLLKGSRGERLERVIDCWRRKHEAD